jgi:uncharacterized protein (TIGR02001 family)
MTMKLAWAAGILLLAGQSASADISVTGTVISDYDFRGISQTSGDPALQVSIDYSRNLFYATAWGSNVDFNGLSTYGDGSQEDILTDGDVELDLIAGFAGETKGGLRWDVGGIVYLYPGSDDVPGSVYTDEDDKAEIADYAEWFVGGGYGPVDAKIWYSPDLYDSDETALYVEANAGFSLPAEIGLNLHAGYNFGDYFDAIEDDFGEDASYWDYSVGLGRTFGRFDFEVKYVGNVIDSFYDVDKGVLRNDERVLFSVSTTFPWADEEGAE